MIHAIKTRQSAGAVMTEALNSYCKAWGLPADLSARRTSINSARESDQASESVEAAA
jgi:hypothetical protein